MAKTEYKCDKKGKFLGKTYKAKQGEEILTVTVTHDVAIPDLHIPIVIETALGTKELHKSEKVKGQGNLNPIGYIHGTKNTCFLVTRLDTKRHTIQIDKIGDVNDGWHNF